MMMTMLLLLMMMVVVMMMVMMMIMMMIMSDAFFRAQNAPNQFSAGLRPGHRWRAYNASPVVLQ